MGSTTDGSRPDFSPRALVPGFELFRPRTAGTHISGYAVGVLVWLASYALGTRIVSGGASAVVGAGAVVAAAVTGLYFVTLFVLVIGSPLGDIVAPTFLTVGVPGFVYRALAPSSVPGMSAVTPFSSTGGAALGAVVAGVVITFVGIVVVYWWKDDARGWEAETMPQSFSLLGVLGIGEQSRLPEPELTDREPRGYGRLLGVFFALILAVSVVVAALAPVVTIRPNDVAGSVLVLTVVTYLWLQ